MDSPLKVGKCMLNIGFLWVIVKGKYFRFLLKKVGDLRFVGTKFACLLFIILMVLFLNDL